MNINFGPLVAGLALIMLAGCATESGQVSDATQGNNRPATESPEPEQTTQAPAANPKLGETFTFENGLSLTVGTPTPFTPSNLAAKEEAAAYLTFVVTIVNGTQENYDPALFFATLQSGNTEASSVFDGDEIGSSPSTTVLPGRETTFKLGFGVADPADLVFEVRPGFEYKAAIFTS